MPSPAQTWRRQAFHTKSCPRRRLFPPTSRHTRSVETARVELGGEGPAPVAKEMRDVLQKPHLAGRPPEIFAENPILLFEISHLAPPSHRVTLYYDQLPNGCLD